MTIKPIAALALVFTATPALAQERDAVFTRDGQTYTYTRIEQDDATVLKGRVMPQGDAFRFVIRGRNVRGQIEGRPVSFRIAKPLSAPALQTASR